jgi:hypothetical protein
MAFMSRFTRRPLARELTIVLTIKVVLLVLAGVFLFGADSRPQIDAALVTHHLLGPTPSLAR